MQKVILLKGLPASGKSTWAKKIIKENKGWKRINKDNLRSMIDVDIFSPENEKIILEARNNLLRLFLSRHYNVIIDDTNFHEKHSLEVNKIINEMNTRGYDIYYEEKFFDVDVNEAIKRDSNRVEQVGESVIRNMYEKYIHNKKIQMKTFKEIIDIPEIYENNKNLPKAIIVDLDGTLAIHKNRGPFEYDKIDTDTPNKPVVTLVKIMKEYGYDILFVSGRDEVSREITTNWLYDVFENVGGLEYPSELKLIMRKRNDNRKDSIVKKELFGEHIKNKYYIEFVLDDRNSVVSMWRTELGLPCFQVNYGDF